jgi:hypothetical protein
VYPNISRVTIVLCIASVVNAQPAPHGSQENPENVIQRELFRRIFDGEHKTIALFAKSRPVVETYAQSLNPDVTPEAVIDDAYFLSRVSLDPDSTPTRVLQRFAFGRTYSSQQIKMDNQLLWWLHPEGYVDMLFVDLTDFDEDYYTLKYRENVMLGDTACMLITVTPVEPKWPGQFTGNIWVETTGLHIVRIEGTFTPRKPRWFQYLNLSGMSTLDFYLHFDSRRQEVSPGVWLPAYTYFDEKQLWNQTRLSTGYHFRGHILAWGYRDSNEYQISQAQTAADPLSRLQDAGLIAVPGAVERWLDGIVHDIQVSGHIVEPEVHCRVLMTTPVEIFSVGNSIVVSRGLLNILPSRSVLGVLLAREIAYISLKRQGPRMPNSKATPIFDARRTSEFPGLGLAHSKDDGLEAQSRLAELLVSSPYAGAVSLTDKFEELLARESLQVPQLLRARFGIGLVNKKAAHEAKASSLALPSQTDRLLLRSDYWINSWENEITVAVPNALADSAERRSGSNNPSSGTVPR